MRVDPATSSSSKAPVQRTNNARPEYSCAICAAGFDRQRARRDKARSRVKRPYNKSRHLWLDRFRVVGRYEEDDADVGYISGQCLPKQARGIGAYTAGPKAGYDPGRPKVSADPPFEDGHGVARDFIAVYGYDAIVEDHIAFPAHDACLLMFSKALAFVIAEGTSAGTVPPVASSANVNTCTFANTLQPVNRARNLSMEYFELDRLAELNYWRVPMALQGFFLDPLAIPELDRVAASPPMVADRPSTDNYLSRLPLEILGMIIQELPTRARALLVSEGYCPDLASGRDWKSKLQDEMPYIWEFSSLDWNSEHIDWAKLYYLCFSDVRKMGMGTMAPSRLDGAVAMRVIDDIEHPSEARARQLYRCFVGGSEELDLPDGMPDDLADIDEQDAREYHPPIHPGMESDDDDAPQTGSLPSFEAQFIATLPKRRFDQVAFPNFPGLSNRRRIWKICLPMADAYLRTMEDKENIWTDTEYEEEPEWY